MKLNQLTITFLITLAAISGTSAAQAASLSVIANGLDNPRNFDFAPDGSIYLTTSGKGGDGNDGRCIPSPSAQYIPLCAGSTGSLIKIAPDGTRTNVLNSLTSIALVPSGEQAAGPADFKFDSQGNGYLLTGVAGNPNERDTKLKAPDLGKLYKVDLGTGGLTTLADFAQYEIENNVDGTDLISNPYALTIKGNMGYVVDGGANTISSVALDGSGIKKTVALPKLLVDPSELEFPSIPPIGEIPGGDSAPPSPGTGDIPPGQAFPITQQSVPTGVTVAPDGSLTVAEYSYFPYPEGKARIFSVDPETLEVKTLADGFTQLTGVTYDPEGNLYALQHINTSEWKEIQQGGVVTGDISGSIIKIGKDGTRETIWNGEGLEAASGLVFGPDGSLYTSNRARLAEAGQLIKIDPKGTERVPEPTSAIALVAIGVGAAAMRKRKRQEKLGEELLSKVEIL
jgi:streptogramin lyase